MRVNRISQMWTTAVVFATATCSAVADEGGFPFILPQERPYREMSAAVERNYSDYATPRPEDNELFSDWILTPRG